MKKIAIVLVLFLAGCVRVPQNVEPVENFSLEKYLGQWYEIARLDHSFERGLNRVTATYTLRDDGGVRVLNRGYSEKDKVDFPDRLPRAWMAGPGRQTRISTERTIDLRLPQFC